ncbi:MAG: c-type cytochrome [Deltaproteobacteria bacterium]|nr:c-type cytochrome [Deltaproteobacteria bacterium]
MKKVGIGVAMVLAAAAAGACGGGSVSRPAKDARDGSPAPRSPESACASGLVSSAEPIGWTGNGATLALARIEGRRVALVADEDAKAILTVDLETKTELAQTPLGAMPGHLYVAKDGRVIVAMRDANQVAVFTSNGRAGEPLAKRCAIATPAEPVAIAASQDDGTMVVSAGWGRKLLALDGKTLASRFEAKLPREPRSVVVSDDGKTAFVSHAVGSVMSAVDLAGQGHEVKELSLRGHEPGQLQQLEMQRKRIKKMHANDPEAAKAQLEELETEAKREIAGRPSCQGFALAKSTAVPGRIFAPQVMVDPGDPEQRPDGYGDENQQTETPAVAVVDEGAKQPMVSSLTMGREHLMFQRGRDSRDPRPECLLPRAAAVDAKTKSLLVTCYGIDAVIAYDAASASPLTSERRRWTVGSGPSGIVVDPDKHRAVVWSQFDRTLSTFPIGGSELADDKVAPPLVVRTAMAPLKEKLPAEYALGRILFHAAGDMRISGDGRACASCHPDGRDDAITWATPEGPRRSIMLAGRASRTAPYSWNGNENTLHNHLGNTFDRLSGKGLRSIELDALVTYVTRMPAPPAVTLEKGEKEKAERGRQIFASAEAGCASCHSGADMTDGQNHDVSSKHKSDRAGAFNTPSLHLVGGTGPYFHDGRYTSLKELLQKSDGKMGKTAHLSPNDLDALETFLRTL